MGDWAIPDLSVVPETPWNPCLAAVGWSLVPSLGPSTLNLNWAFQQLHPLKVGFKLTLKSESIKGSFLAFWNQHLSVLFYSQIVHLTSGLIRVASLCIFYAAVLSNPNEKWQDSSILFLWLFPSPSPSPFPIFSFILSFVSLSSALCYICYFELCPSSVIASERLKVNTEEQTDKQML